MVTGALAARAGAPGAFSRAAIALAVVVVVGLGGFVRLRGLDDPPRIYFDEKYYVTDARALLDRGVEEERPAHPPLGKWVIAAGIAAAGDEPVGWRIANAVAGTLTVLLAVIGVRLLTGSWWPSLVAGSLIAFDGLSVAGSRIAMLDASLALFVTAGFVLLVLDHELRHRPGVHRWIWRWSAAAALGAAVATKWSGATALVAAVVVVVVPAVRAERDRKRLPKVLARTLLPFVVASSAAYLLSYLPWVLAYERSETAEERCEQGACGTGIDDRLVGLVREHTEVIAFHQRLKATHPDRSWPWRWPLLQDPVLFFLERCGPDTTPCPLEEGEERRILGLGNPALWWPALLLVPAGAVVAVRRRLWGLGATIAFALAQWLPWFAAGKPGFSFYLIPVAPFVAMAVGVLSWQLRARAGRWWGLGLAALAVAAFLALHPLLVGTPMGEEQRDRLMILPSWDS